jgi:hypothetical protein
MPAPVCSPTATELTHAETRAQPDLQRQNNRARPPNLLACRSYDLRHVAIFLWLNSGGTRLRRLPGAGHGAAILLKFYAHCIDGQADAANRRITDALARRYRELRSEPLARPSCRGHCSN